MPATLPNGLLRDPRQRLEAHDGGRRVRAMRSGAYARREGNDALAVAATPLGVGTASGAR